MSQPLQTQPLSRDQVLDEIAFLITAEHALIVEYLAVSCAFGYNLEPAPGDPVNQAGRDAAKAGRRLADLLMLRVARLVRVFSAFRPTGGVFGRAAEIADASGAKISLEPLSGPLEYLLDREVAIAAAVDAQYARLIPAMAVSESGNDAFSDDLREMVQQGTNHANGVSDLQEPLAGQSVADLLRATRRSGSTDAEKALFQASDRAYGMVVGALQNFYGDLRGDNNFRLDALAAMDELNSLNATMVRARLLPSFRRPPP